MIKRIGLVVSVCLTALLISSCSDGGTKSGIANFERSSAFESYVDKYPDLVAAYNGTGSGQTKSAWGETHYCNNGRTEGRTYNGLSAASCSSTTSTTTTTSDDAFEGYVDKYADLLAVFNASGGGQTKSAWGKTHYCNYGRNEGRTYSNLSASSCSTTTTSTTTTTTGSGDAYEGYVNKYADLLAAFNASGGGQTKSAWGKNHYCNHGLSEGRSYTELSTASCGGTSSGIDGQPPLTGVWVGAWGSDETDCNGFGVVSCDGGGIKATITETNDHSLIGTFHVYAWLDTGEGTFHGTRSGTAGWLVILTVYSEGCTLDVRATKFTNRWHISGTIQGVGECSDGFAYFYLKKMEL